jgi:anaerobic magnesium-protoporphyrin IX monomethyl ester cyclase
MYKVVLVNPVFGRGAVDYVPTGLCYLSAYLKAAAPCAVDVRVLNASATDIGRILAVEPDLVGFRAFTHSYNLTVQTAQAVRSALPRVRLVIGGPHITNAPWSMHPVFDCAAIGEGEATFVEVVRALASGGVTAGIQGTQSFVDGQLRNSGRRPLIEPVDSIPFPDRDCVEDLESVITTSHAGWFGQDRLRSMQLTTSRGCPFKCVFCQPSSMWQKLRMHSPEYVAAEIEHIHQRYGVQAIFVEDDLFTGNKKRVANLIELLGRKSLLGRTAYYVGARTAQIDTEWVELLRTLGVVKVEFAIESGSERVASYLKNSDESTAVNQRAISLLNDAGISVYASFIAGSPPEQLEDLRQTFELMNWIRRRRPGNTVGLNIATPLPGTRLWDYAVERGHIQIEGFDWDRLSSRQRIPRAGDKLVYLNDHIRPAQLIRMIRRQNRAMYLGSPRQFVGSLPRRVRKMLARLWLRVAPRA